METRKEKRGKNTREEGNSTVPESSYCKDGTGAVLSLSSPEDGMSPVRHRIYLNPVVIGTNHE